MLAELSQHRTYLQAEWEAAQGAPLSARKAMLVAALIDAYVDRLFAVDPQAEDILEFRAAWAARDPAIGLIMALCSRRSGFALLTEAVTVPLDDYDRLGVEDFMVSLYNDHSVQRVLLALPDNRRRDMMDVLATAIAALD